MTVAHLRLLSSEGSGDTPIDSPTQGASERAAHAAAKRVSETPEAAVARLYRTYKDVVFRIALRYGGGDRNWAEDVTHDIFVDIFRHLAQIDTLDNPQAWFYRVATNRCLTRIKGRARRKTLLSMSRFGLDSGARQTPEETCLESDRLRRALASVDTMPPEARACFYMHHIDGLQQKEIAEVLGRSRSKVCRLLQQVAARLRAIEAAEARDV